MFSSENKNGNFHVTNWESYFIPSANRLQLVNICQKLTEKDLAVLWIV